MSNAYDWLGRLGLILAIVGALNWLLVGLFEYNLVADIFGSGTQDATTGARVVYTIVGIGGIIAIPMIGATLSRRGTGVRDTRAYPEDEVSERRRAA